MENLLVYRTKVNLIKRNNYIIYINDKCKKQFNQTNIFKFIH